MCAGVVPQQPPTMLRKPASAQERILRRHLLRPEVVAAHLVRQTGVGVRGDVALAMRDISSTYWRSSKGPSAQLRPIDSGLAWRSEL